MRSGLAIFLFRRVLHGLLLLGGVSMLSFVLADLAPGDFYGEMRLNARVSTETIAALRAQHGLTQPLWVRYGRWLASVARGEWGFSFSYNAPAGPILWVRARNTLLLAGSATAFAWLVALPLGVLAGARPHGWLDSIGSVASASLLAMPELVLGLLLLLAAVRSGALPVGGFVSLSKLGAPLAAQAVDIGRHMILPALCLAAGLLPIVFSHVRSSLREALASPFISAARGYGIPERRILVRQALPAAANPLISLFGLTVGMLLSSSLLIEALFSWPGLGRLMVEAIFARDVFLVIDSAVLAAGFLIAGNVLADVLLYLSDPRIRVA